MTAEPAFWKRCSTCKKALPFESVYWECNVSTCNRPRTALAFCSVPCWDAHVPTLRHRDAWAEERRSPRREEWERQQREEATRSGRAAGRMRACPVGIPPDSPAAAGEASAADGHARFRSRRGQAQSPNGSHESREAFRTARVRSAALASPAAARRWRVT